MPDRFSCSAKGDLADAVEGNLRNGREDGVYRRVSAGELPMTALCERYGISRDTGYRLLRRYREEGPGGLEPRAPHRHGNGRGGRRGDRGAAAPAAVLETPKKLRAVLQRRDPKQL